VKAQLEVIAGPEEGKVIALEEWRGVVVGRGAACHLRIRDPRVSRTHFLLERRPPAYRIFDLASSGGTFVNGQRIVEQDLASGDVIRIGHSELRFVLGESSQDATPAPLPPPEELKAKSDESVLATVGKRLAGFEILAPIGAGRLSYVFKACDPRKKLTVALKILRPEYSGNQDEMRRFVRAMKSAIELKHPNVVRVYTAGRAGGHSYVVMEYVDGESLAETIGRIGTAGPLDWTRAFRIGTHAARALQAARQHAVVHRNITPHDILVRREDGVAKLADLMQATAIEGTTAERVMRAGASVGEMAYMSPERTASDADVDGRSDIYSLGATLYALLAGRPPLEDKSPSSLVARIRDQKPKSLKEFHPAIPGPLESLIMRMLAKRPEDRFQTPADLLEELERIGRDHGLNV